VSKSQTEEEVRNESELGLTVSSSASRLNKNIHFWPTLLWLVREVFFTAAVDGSLVA